MGNMGRQPTVRNDPKRNSTFSASQRIKHVPMHYDEDDEDTRDMTGRIRTEAGYEVHRSHWKIGSLSFLFD